MIGRGGSSDVPGPKLSKDTRHLRRNETAGCCDNQPPATQCECVVAGLIRTSLWLRLSRLAQEFATRRCHQYLRSRALSAIGSGAMREVLVALANPYHAPHSSHIFAKLALLL